MKNYLKFIGGALIATCLSVQAQNYAYNSFINGYNLLNAVSAANTTNNIYFGQTNIAMAFGQNNYTYNGTYPVSANNAYIATNTVFGTMAAFGWQTNTTVIRNAAVFPDGNGNINTGESIFVNINGVNNAVTNEYAFVFSAVAAIPVPAGSGTITNYVAATSAQNKFTLLLTANGTNPVNVFTNLPAGLEDGSSAIQLSSVGMVTTNSIGYATNYYVTTTLTNGTWQPVTNSVIVTNWGGVYINAGVVGYPPFK
jgi:hypothetical protein